METDRRACFAAGGRGCGRVPGGPARRIVPETRGLSAHIDLRHVLDDIWQPAEYEQKAADQYWVVATDDAMKLHECRISRMDADVIAAGAATANAASLAATRWLRRCFEPSVHIRTIAVEGSRVRVDWDRMAARSRPLAYVSRTRSRYGLKRPACTSFSICPSRRCTVRWANAAMSASCVTRIIVLPASCSRAKRLMISAPVFESRLPVGSSASSSEGLFTSALAIATLCRCPPESSFGRWVIRGSEIDSLERELGAAPRGLLPEPSVNKRQLHVVERRSARQQIEGLKNEPDLLVADARELVVIHVADAFAVQQISASRRSIEAPDEVHECRFAGARGSHDGDVLAALDLH